MTMHKLISNILHKTVAKLNKNKNKVMTNLIAIKATPKSEDIHFLKYAGSPGFFRSPNIGDALSPYIYECLSGHKALYRLEMSNPNHLANYMTVGSILQFADEKTIVWGSGFNSKNSVFGCQGWKQVEEGIAKRSVEPRKFCAVRGPLTRKRVLELGVECTNVLGDPGLLMPLLYNPLNKEKTTLLGIIPHFSHVKSQGFQKLLFEKRVKIISVYQHPETFIDELVQCEYVISSSLHGLILADAYDIPSLWICPSDHLNNTTSFKYLDYLGSIESSQQERIVITPQTKVKDIMPKLQIISKKKINLVPLLESCPFISSKMLFNLIESYSCINYGNLSNEFKYI